MDFSTRWSTQAPGSAASRLICLTTVILALAACGQEPDRSPNTSGGSQAATEIAWYEGDVDSAFALAKRQGKPLFLYWGAEWCPPCHYLKKKIFTRPEFIARMQDFVPVYPVSYTHLTLPTTLCMCRSRWSAGQ